MTSVGVCVAIALTALSLMPSNAAATLKVYAPTVEYREFEIEWRGGYEFDTRTSRDGANVHKLAAGYGVLPRVFVEAYAEMENPPGGGGEFEAFEFEGRVQLTEPGQYWMDAGLLVEYELSLEDGGSDAAEIAALLEKQTGTLAHRANVLVERSFASDADVETGLGWSTRYRAGQGFEPGIEYHARFGPVSGGTPFDRQTHYAGPAACGRLGSVRYDVGYLVGLSDDASDGLFKWSLEYEIRF
jgi:hypothetical protein